jgi:hypothetical protein
VDLDGEIKTLYTHLKKCMEWTTLKKLLALVTGIKECMDIKF